MRDVMENRLPDLSHLHILIAEDNVTNQLVAREMLETMGATVNVASDGAEALERLEGEDYDLLLVDIEMPRVSGLDVIKHVRAGREPLASRPIVAFTAYAMPEHERRILEAGADGLIPKPIVSIQEFGDRLLWFRRNRGFDATPEHDPARAANPPIDAEALGVDLKIYDALISAIGQDSAAELLERVAEDITKERDRIADALEPCDLAAIRRATHIIISVAGAIGAVDLQHRARDMNRAANEDDADRTLSMAPGLLTSSEDVLLFVSRKQAE